MKLHKDLKRAKKEQTLGGRMILKVVDQAREKSGAIFLKEINKTLEDPSDEDYDSDQEMDDLEKNEP